MKWHGSISLQAAVGARILDQGLLEEEGEDRSGTTREGQRLVQEEHRKTAGREGEGDPATIP